MIEPITPKEAKKAKLEAIPDFILQAINDILEEKVDINGVATIKQDEIIACAWEIVDDKESYDNKISNFTAVIFSRKWLDIEDLYGQYGWKVCHDEPAYNEFYSAYFKFKPIEK